MNKKLYNRYNLELVAENDEDYNSIQIKNKQVSSPIIVNEINRICKLDTTAEEYVILRCLDSKNYINSIFEISHGGIASANLDISNILKRALLSNSPKIILCHNHPSGDVSPSKKDYILTDQLYDASETVGIKLLDHIIIGHNKYKSLLLDRKGAVA